MLRKIAAFGIITAMLLFAVSCNLKQRIGDSITEGILEKAVGNDVDIDLDSDSGSLTIQGQDGEELVIDNDENGNFRMEGEDGTYIQMGDSFDWPEDKAAAELPKMNNGQVTYVINSDVSCSIMVAGTGQEDFEDYVEKLKAKGFTEEAVTSDASELKIYSAKDSSGAIAYVAFAVTEESLQISVDLTNVQE